MLTHFQMVQEFHEKFGLPIRTEPKIPIEKEVILRTDLDEEEFEEFCEANEDGNLVGCADALTDQLYVAYGQGLVYGIDLNREYNPPEGLAPYLPTTELKANCIRRLETRLADIIDAHTRGIDKIKEALNLYIRELYITGEIYGIDLNKCFTEVHRSNMSKLGEDGKVIYREDGKVLKGPNFTPPDLKKVLGL